MQPFTNEENVLINFFFVVEKSMHHNYGIFFVYYILVFDRKCQCGMVLISPHPFFLYITII